ncbi:MAG: NnrU family protein [Gammaproteobacteria bacterium]
MTLLVAGMLLWMGVHLYPVFMADSRNQLVGRIGEMPYKGIFALAILASVALIILGWRSATPEIIYNPPAALRHPAMLLVTIAFIFFVLSSFRKSRLNKFIRHPQLTGVKTWAVAHLLANGDSKSLILFGGMLVWAVLSVIFINRRDGAREKPTEFMPVWMEVLIPVIAVVITGLIVKYHYYIAGVPLIASS